MANGYRNGRTEHAGAKRGKGAWDRKATAKRASNKARRANDKKECGR